VSRSTRYFKTFIADNQPVIECYFLKEYCIDLNGCKRSIAMLDQHYENTFYLFF